MSKHQAFTFMTKHNIVDAKQKEEIIKKWSGDYPLKTRRERGSVRESRRLNYSPCSVDSTSRGRDYRQTFVLRFGVSSSSMLPCHSLFSAENKQTATPGWLVLAAGLAVSESPRLNAELTTMT